MAAPGHEEILAANPAVMTDCHFDPACTWKLYHASGGEIDIRADQYAEEITSRAQTIELAGQPVYIAAHFQSIKARTLTA